MAPAPVSSALLPGMDTTKPDSESQTPTATTAEAAAPATPTVDPGTGFMATVSRFASPEENAAPLVTYDSEQRTAIKWLTKDQLGDYIQQEYHDVTLSNSEKMNVLAACYEQFDQILAHTVGAVVGQLVPMSAEAESVLWGDNTHLQKRVAHIASQGVTSPELSAIGSGPADSLLPDTAHDMQAHLSSNEAKETTSQTCAGQYAGQCTGKYTGTRTGKCTRINP
eukprot:COSAG01_NODE_4164_length_5278_cov_21.606295_3_plen_224_part_00